METDIIGFLQWDYSFFDEFIIFFAHITSPMFKVV